MQVFSPQGDITSTDHAAKKDDEDEERDEHLTLCSCLDGVISHLQKQMETLKSYQRQPQEPIETTGAVQSKIVDMYDVCCSNQQGNSHIDTGGHSSAKINKAALSTLAGHLCSFCPETLAQVQLHIRVQTTLHVYPAA